MADSMVWCESNSVEYVLGLAKNARLTAAIEKELAQAKAGFEQTGQATRVFSVAQSHSRTVVQSAVVSRQSEVCFHPSSFRLHPCLWS